jgi:hypothetical protein
VGFLGTQLVPEEPIDPMAKALGKRGRSGEGRQKNTSKAKAPEKRKKRQKV